MASVTLTPSGYEGTTNISSIANETNYGSSSSSTYAALYFNRSVTGYVFYTFNTSSIPATATITSVTAQGKTRVSNTTYFTDTVMQLYSGTTPKGSNTTYNSTTASARTIDAGSWTRSELNDLRLKIGGTTNNSGSSRNIRFYGADVTITYTESAPVSVTGVSVSPSTQTIEVGNTATLTAEVSPSNATNKTVTWSTSNSSVATVSDGVVTGVSAGSARITATASDGGYTDYCDVTVTTPTYYEYVLTNTLTPGKKYLIANGNTGSVYLMSAEANGSRTLKGVSETVSNNKISITGSVKAKVEFSCSLSNSSNIVTTCIMNDGKYLYCDNANGLRMNTVSNIDRFWHFNSNKFWQFKSSASDGYSDTSSEYKYYLQVSNGNFTDNHVSTTSIEDSTLPAIYLFEEYSGATDTLYFKSNGSWVEAVGVYKKINGSWVEQTDLTQVFDSGTDYKWQ